MTLPVSTIVTVNIDRQTLFPQGPGFGTLMIIFPDTTANGGGISLSNRIKSYASIDEVAVDFISSTDVYKAANAYFSQNPRPTLLKVGMRDATPPGTFAQELDIIQALDPDWYGFILTEEARISADPSLSAAAAVWAESKTKLFVTSSNEAAALTGSGLVGDLENTYDRTMVIYHHLAAVGTTASYPEAALFGNMLTVDFDGVNTTKTAKFKRLRGQTVSPLNSSQLSALTTHKGNAYVSIAGTPMFMNGTMTTGEFFDVMHGIDWLTAEIQTRVFGRLATLPKVPYTEAGMEILKNEVRLALKQGVKNGLLAATFDDEGNLLEAFDVTSIPVLDVSQASRAARTAPSITFTARLAGAVHKVTINGTVTV